MLSASPEIEGERERQKREHQRDGGDNAPVEMREKESCKESCDFFIFFARSTFRPEKEKKKREKNTLLSLSYHSVIHFHFLSTDTSPYTRSRSDPASCH